MKLFIEEKVVWKPKGPARNQTRIPLNTRLWHLPILHWGIHLSVIFFFIVPWVQKRGLYLEVPLISQSFTLSYHSLVILPFPFGQYNRSSGHNGAYGILDIRLAIPTNKLNSKLIRYYKYSTTCPFSLKISKLHSLKEIQN